ncbi:MAG: DUF166 domain-containing protein [Methanothrix sp.]|jgi:hypothetical protein|uniref:Thymidylate synthase n=1 Tax=Methanothrix harundinacea TaxID=301375 RepID=A0A101IFA9_9EURY|nr:MAG: Thymidylate synthase [Methanothrix harundinacea]MDD2639183.1 DUF166 domain-containing protein [Methanothrix sp.]MDI9399282.1 DUF166 domain-containing protein [Euryarchaeota archaeon]KUK94141.1 MAG: Thymidylate synthase [Methanothrix harundinacea]MCP1393346.1 DUF166 domain-containing protein [Methanothrix harundinacea]
MKVVVFYNGEFGRTLIGNLINFSGFCISCGDACTLCKSGKYSMAEDIVSVIEMPDPETLDDFIDDVDPYLPKEIPEADIAIVVNVHPDIIFGLLPVLKDNGYSGIIGGSESPKELPLGLRTQLSEEARKIGLEAAFAKPFCALRPDPAAPTISAFMEKAHFGEPRIEIVTQESRPGKETILAANVVRSAPCGSTWYVAKRMTGLETDQPDLRERISEAHHAYPCTASMDQDPELKDTILHKAGYIVREAVEEAIERAERAEPKDSGTFSGSGRPRVGADG